MTRDRLNQIVDQLLDIYFKMLADGAVEWETIEECLRLILHDLEPQAPGHPALERLRAIIANRGAPRH